MKRLLSHLFFLVSIMLLTGCEKEFNDGYEIFLIKKGQHYATYKVSTLQSDRLSFYVKFDESANYRTVDPVNQWDINKLMGFSEGNSPHHENSARFGWRWMDDQIEIFAYAYVNGDRVSEYLGATRPHEAAYYELILLPDAYRFHFKDQTIDIPRVNPPSGPAFYYLLYPYFGGDEPAPQDITIQMKFIY